MEAEAHYTATAKPHTWRWYKTMRSSHLYMIAVATVLLTVAKATADVVMTSDGSRIVGKIERLADGKLAILTEIAGRLEIDASKITGITTDQAVSVAVVSGDTLVGTMEASPEGDAMLIHSALGDIPIEASKMTLLWPEGAESPEVVAVREKADAELEAAKPKWSAKLEGGIVRKEGNTDTLKGHGRFDLKRTTTEDLLHFYLAGRYSEENDVRSTNEYFGGVRYEDSLTERRFWYARTEFEFDEFEDIDLRATAAAGVGYYWLRQPEHELKTNLGLGYRHESYTDDRTEDEAVLDLGLDYRVDVVPWLQFTQSTVYTPDIEDLDDYRMKFDTAFLIPFKDERWAWKVGMRNDYNSRPQPGLDRLDNLYYTSIVLSIE